ncbi:hypothetical protein EV645_6278 [Kribbella rubisoli]|uniref:Tachylectin n=1 Tax=Kribbella rubisoli TaxID=3075929 RepID=A0A4Q7WM72_9ACTN|nr:hypothetical protein [Kribbella rubisoli]RZU11120.1 hypothetical protein EV645_6278 [Kribbella rubisoli]
MNRTLVAGAVAAVLAVGFLPTSAGASPRATTEACAVDLGSVTAGGDSWMQFMAATSPPTRTYDHIVGRDVYPDGQVRLSATMSADANAAGPEPSGYLVLGDALYKSFYAVNFADGEILRSGLSRIGGGWASFTAVDQSTYSSGSFYRTNTYGLSGDGVLFRWTVDTQGGWRNKASYPGFSAVKSMTLISQTRTYDTFLANTRGGALYTIHIPTATPMKPVVKLVRGSTWQGFEALVAERCGQYGTLLLGIDKDTKSAYLYAVGHANGTATVIQNRGKLPVSLDDPVYFHWTGPAAAPPFGE